MFSLFTKPEYRKFNLKPRYWDPEKEARIEREKRIKAELGIKDDDNYTPHIRGQFRKEFEKHKAIRSSMGSAQTIRFFMILIMLFLIAFYIFVKNPEGIMNFFGL